MIVRIPKLSLVVLIGPSGAGKSTFARRHFLESEILSADRCRAMVSDDENDQSVTKEAFEILHYIAAKRLAHGKLVVIDATNVQKEARKPIINLAREFHCLPVAIVFDVPERLCEERNQTRSDRNFGKHVIGQQSFQMRRSLKGLKGEGFRHIFKLTSQQEVDEVSIERVPLWNDKRDEGGPFDIIGDVHGCCGELEELLQKLGYVSTSVRDDKEPLPWPVFTHPEGRKAIFLGDLADRGPRILDTFMLVSSMVKAGSALCVPGNHDIKFMRKLRGMDVKITHGLAESLAEIEALPQETQNMIKRAIHDFVDSLVSHYVLDDGRLVVAHAGLKEKMQGRGSAAVREFCLFGETTGETDEFGLPVRYNWAAEYRGRASVVYGHTPVLEPEWLNNTINIDTGCVFGGKLTALRYPEKELVSVVAHETYSIPVRNFKHTQEDLGLTTQQILDDTLDLDDISGKRIVETRLATRVTIQEENGMAALEVMSRFAVNPKWLIYLPPTMSPTETTSDGSLLEHPAEAFAYYRKQGVHQVVCEEKHMGSRAIVVICRDESVSISRFGIIGDGIGTVYTRTGRPFFDEKEIEKELLARIKRALDASEFWDTYNTDWACFDCELMPWSAKAQDLLKNQYAAVGAAAQRVLEQSSILLQKAINSGHIKDNQADGSASSSVTFNPKTLLDRIEQRRILIGKYIHAYRQYCWPINSITDFKLAPFHVMATEDKLYTQLDHVRHLEILHKICSMDTDVLLSTNFMTVDLNDAESEKQATDWWLELTSKGGEGMVVKPHLFLTKGKKGIVQPGVKCRGPEYLRIIYGPEYSAPEHLARLRARSVGTKRSLALREFALGIEGLERFINKEPLRRIHECVFGVLALESEPVDPRL